MQVAGTIKVNLATMHFTVKENYCTETPNTLEISLLEESMAKGFKPGKMDKPIQDFGRITVCMVKESGHFRMEQKKEESGQTEIE